jgi:hypothetical protein
VAIATKGDSARKVESPWQRLCFDGLVFRSQAKAPALSFGRGKGGGGKGSPAGYISTGAGLEP